MSDLLTYSEGKIKKGHAGNYSRQIIVIGGFFFIFGFVTWLNGILVPYLKIVCELQEWQAYLVTFAFYISYTVMALPSGRILQYTGMIRGMQLGLVAIAAGCFLFIPAAYQRAYGPFLLGLFVVGAGLTLIQTAVNPYITLLGPPQSAAKRISIMGLCNKFAGILAPLILGAIILKDGNGLMEELRHLSSTARVTRLDRLAETVILPYTIMGIALLLLALLIRYVHLPELQVPPKEIATAPELRLSSSQKKNLYLGFLAIFATVGVEVIAGDTISNYGLYQGLPLDKAKSLTAYTLTGMMTGYFFGAFAIPRYLAQEKAFLVSSFLGLTIAVLIIFLPGLSSVGAVAFLGVANALLWPAIWPQALRGLGGKALNRASAVLIMGIAGGAILPLLYGWIGQYFNPQIAYCILIPCYLYNVYYWKKTSMHTS